MSFFTVNVFIAAACRILDTRRQHLPSGGVVFFLFLVTNACSAAEPADSSQTKAAAKPVVSASAPAQPLATNNAAWNRLTPMQQQALEPLAASWSNISEQQRRKWLAISKNYPSLPPAEQLVMHGRMVEWTALTPVQRAEARLNFAKTNELSKQLTPAEKLAKWQAYQALSTSEKESLASKAGPKPIGAALAVRPVATQKLVGVGPHAQTNSHASKPSAAPASAPSDTSQAR